MINILNDFYEIKIDTYKEYNKGIIFYINGYNYYFCKCLYTEEMLVDIVQFAMVVKERGIKLHDFILNKDGGILSNGYVLLKLNILIDDISYFDCLKFCNTYIDNLSNDNVKMNEFWYSKLEYLEKQLIELSDNKLINNSFDYYSGVAEILLLFFSNNNIRDNDNYLVHKEMYTLNSIDFYNPLNISLGSKYKDIAYYIRLCKDYDLIEEYLERLNINEKLYFFIRLCFPYQYFHEISLVLLDKKSEIDLVSIINDIDQYENYLLMIEDYFCIKLFHYIKKE